ncbi:MAG: CRISPR-associated RAMP protein Csx7, partial [Acidobacteriota bacterium]
MLDIFERRLRLEGQLITRTGLHIGAGGSGDPIGTDLPVVRDGLGRPMIPGASLKGVMRSAAEALLRHFPRPRQGTPAADHPLLWTCDIIGKDPCLDHDRLKELREELSDRPKAGDLRSLAEKAWNESCTVCRLFGSSAMAGRVRFPDLLLAPKQASLMEVRNGVGIDRDKGQAAAGVLYDFEAVPPQTRFELTVIADNYDDFEIGLLLYLFDELHRGSLALGGKTTRGLGQVEVRWRHLEETSVNPSLDGANPFANLLRRECFQEEAGEPAERELPIPGGGEREKWQELALTLDGLESVTESD